MTVGEWDEFATGLTAAFRQVGSRVFVIVAAQDAPTRYVQFAGGAESLVAEAPAADIAIGADEMVLDVAGWSRPDVGQPNWSSTLPLPALTAEYRDLAHRCVAALRDAYGIRSPADLSYRAWREPEHMPPGETWSAERVERLDPGANTLELPDLGLVISGAARPRDIRRAVRHTLTTPPSLQSVHQDRRVMEAPEETFTIDLPEKANPRSDWTASLMADVRIRTGKATSRLRVFAHRETAGMTARDYGAEIVRELYDLHPELTDVTGGYSTLMGRSSPLVGGVVGAERLVALCAAPGAIRILVVGTSPAGNDDAERDLRSAIDSLEFVGKR